MAEFATEQIQPGTKALLTNVCSSESGREWPKETLHWVYERRARTRSRIRAKGMSGITMDFQNPNIAILGQFKHNLIVLIYTKLTHPTLNRTTMTERYFVASDPARTRFCWILSRFGLESAFAYKILQFHLCISF